MSELHIDSVRHIWESRNCGSCEELAEKHDALAATVEAWKAAFDHLFGHCASNGVFNAWGNPLDCTLLNEANSKSPQQHLRDVRAEAGRAGWVACVDWLVENSSADLFTDGEAEQAREIGDQYAERTRSGSQP